MLVFGDVRKGLKIGRWSPLGDYNQCDFVLVLNSFIYDGSVNAYREKLLYNIDVTFSSLACLFE